MIRVFAYETESGEQPFTAWLDSLDDQVADRITEGLARFEHGNFGDHKGVGEGVMERRFTFGPGYRVYYARDGQELVVLLGGGSKKRQSRDVARAKTLWTAYLDEKRAAEEAGDALEKEQRKGDDDAPGN